MVRNSMKIVSYENRKKIIADLKNMYRPATAEQAEDAIKDFEETWDACFPMIG